MIVCVVVLSYIQVPTCYLPTDRPRPPTDSKYNDFDVGWNYDGHTNESEDTYKLNREYSFMYSYRRPSDSAESR